RLGDINAVAGLSPQLQQLARRYTDAVEELFPLLDRLIVLLRTGLAPVEVQAAIQAPAVQRLARELPAAKSAFDLGVRNEALTSLNALRAQLRRDGTELVAIAIGGVVVTLVLAAAFGLRMARRLQILAGNTERLARRESTAPLRGSDEIAAV